VTASRVLSIALASIPFAFGVIRAVRGGGDVRYVAVAAAGFVGAALTVAIGRRIASVFALAVAVFVVSTLTAVAGALPMGTRLGPGILIVASGFGLCFAAGAWLHMAAGGFES